MPLFKEFKKLVPLFVIGLNIRIKIGVTEIVKHIILRLPPLRERVC